MIRVLKQRKHVKLPPDRFLLPHMLATCTLSLLQSLTDWHNAHPQANLLHLPQDNTLCQSDVIKKLILSAETSSLNEIICQRVKEKDQVWRRKALKIWEDYQVSKEK